MEGKVEEWGTESLLAARAVYVMPETGALLKPTVPLQTEINRR
jgi:hypothetical protein